jgi:hypothetical protein
VDEPAAVWAVSIVEGDYEGRRQFVIRTPSATWYLDRTGGGFPRLLDRDGRDWISIRKEPLSKFPDSAGAGYRGIPNLVFGKYNPDAGAGAPGLRPVRASARRFCECFEPLQ